MDKVSRIQSEASGGSEILLVPIRKTVVHIKKVFQAVRSASVLTQGWRALEAKEVVLMQRMWKTELGPEKFPPFRFFSRQI